MPFTRQRPDGTDDAMRISAELTSSENTRWIQRRIPLFALAACGLLSSSANAKTAKTMAGVWGWTSGSQTYLRARPSAQTPPVAKVARHTKLFVWGKFNGWYRVETTDHVFGWVYYDYIAAPNADKIAELSHKKARLASERTSHQTMYGSKELLASYYDRYGAKGAAIGLKKQGLNVNGTKLVKAVKPKSSPRIASTRSSTPRTATSNIKRIPGSERYARTSQALASETNFNDVGSVRIAPVFHSDAGAPSRAEITQNENAARAAAAKAQAAKAQAAKESARLARLNTEKLQAAKAQAAKEESARLRIANAQAEKARATNAEKARLAASVAARKKENDKKAAEKRLVALRRANYLARVAKNEREHKARLARSAARAAARKQKLASRRNNLRDSLGTPRMAEPPTNAAGMRPISPDELMRARDAYLAAQQKNRPTSKDSVVVVPAPGNPSFVPMSWNDQNAGGAFLLPTTFTARKAKTTPAPVRSGMRGGSPRDRFPAPSKTFGEGMANQALTYRGMPYISGASSPRRGFDCSGLVYYLLQQRGIKSPRTAAGMSRVGQKVGRGELQSGDVVFFANTYKRGVSHVGVYIGNGNFVHAATSRSGVRVDSLSSAYYRKKWHSARRMSK